MKDFNTKLLIILGYFGIYNQQRKLQEEIFELQESIFDIEKDSIEQYENNLEHLTEELADVLVIIKQLQLEYGIEQEDLILMMNNKVDRTLKRIKEGYYK